MGYVYENMFKEALSKLFFTSTSSFWFFHKKLYLGIDNEVFMEKWRIFSG